MSVDTGEAFPRKRTCRMTAQLHVCPALSYFNESSSRRGDTGSSSGTVRTCSSWV